MKEPKSNVFPECEHYEFPPEESFIDVMLAELAEMISKRNATSATPSKGR